jgi:CheY-like chemotaxis protein
MFEKKHHTILMVEDSNSNHPLFVDAFEAGGFAVTIVPVVDQHFVDDVAKSQPDIISMDIMITVTGLEPLHDGLSVISLLKSDERTRDIPIIVLTSFFEESKVERARSEGAADFINLQGHTISTIPKIFKKYLQDPKHYHPVHPMFAKE